MLLPSFLKMEQVGYYAGRVKYDSGPQRFTLISLTGKEILYHLFILCVSSIKIHNCESLGQEAALRDH